MIRLFIQSVGKQHRRDFWRLHDYQIAGSGPTPRAPDGGASAAPSVFFPGFGFSLLPNIVHVRPAASNANRWAATYRLCLATIIYPDPFKERLEIIHLAPGACIPTTVSTFNLLC
jgi:hypothetical protein